MTTYLIRGHQERVSQSCVYYKLISCQDKQHKIFQVEPSYNFLQVIYNSLQVEQGPQSAPINLDQSKAFDGSTIATCKLSSKQAISDPFSKPESLQCQAAIVQWGK